MAVYPGLGLGLGLQLGLVSTQAPHGCPPQVIDDMRGSVMGLQLENRVSSDTEALETIVEIVPIILSSKPCSLV